LKVVELSINHHGERLLIQSKLCQVDVSGAIPTKLTGSDLNIIIKQTLNCTLLH